MTKAEEIQKELDRLAKIKLWAARIEKLKSRKKNPMDEAAFCRKYKFHISHFNRTKNGKGFPGEDFFNAVEKALKAQRV